MAATQVGKNNPMLLRRSPLDEIYENFSFPMRGTTLTPKESMTLAFEAALQGAGYVKQNPMVGAVLVDKDHNFLTGAWHKKFGEAHAEQALLQKVREENLENKLKGASLYCTLEPCAHEGKTPPCSHLLASYPLKKVIYGKEDPTEKVSSKGLLHLQKAGIETELFPSSGELRENLNFLTEHFESFEMEKKIFATVKVASSLNGVYAHRDSEREWITCPRSRKYAHFLRLLSDAILVGAHTVIQDNPSLTDRHFQKKRAPLKVVLDPKGKAVTSRKPSSQNLLQSMTPTWWWMNEEIRDTISKQTLEEAEARGAQFFFFKGKKKEEKLFEVCELLYQKEKPRVLLEGGRSLWGSALGSGFCQRLSHFQAPKLFCRDDIMHWTKEAKIQYLDVKNGIFTLLDKDILIEGLTSASQ